MKYSIKPAMMLYTFFIYKLTRLAFLGYSIVTLPPYHIAQIQKPPHHPGGEDPGKYEIVIILLIAIAGQGQHDDRDI